MAWRILLLVYLLLTAATYLFQRDLGQHLARYRRLVSASFMVLLHYPAGVAVALYSGTQLDIGWVNALLLFGGSLVFPLINILALKASKDIDAGRYTILSNLTPVITIAAAEILLHERLNYQQLVGAVIIIGSACLLALPRLQRKGPRHMQGISAALSAFFLAGLATVYERWMLTRMDYGAYLIIGWGFQAAWSMVVAWPDRRRVRHLLARRYAVPILGYGLAGAVKGICFIIALKLCGNAAVFGAFTSFTTIIVVPAAYFILKEKKWLWFKLASATIGTVGLIILNLGKI